MFKAGFHPDAISVARLKVLIWGFGGFGSLVSALIHQGVALRTSWGGPSQISGRLTTVLSHTPKRYVILAITAPFVVRFMH